MKQLILLITMTIATIAYSQNAGIENKLWRLEYANIDGHETYFSQMDLFSPTILFYNGKIRGNSGCNAYHTTYSYNDTYEINIGYLSSTKMACNKPKVLNETAYYNALQSIQFISYNKDAGICIFKNLKGDTLRFFLQGEKK